MSTPGENDVRTPGRNKPPVFSAFAVSLTGNRGAVSMLEAAIDHLTGPETRGVVNVFTVYPRADARRPARQNVRLYSGTPINLVFKLIPLCLLYRLAKLLHLPLPAWIWGKQMRALLDTDVCLMIGGTTFSDAKPIKVPYNVACLLPAILLKKKAMMYSQTLGPFRRRFNRFCARWCLSRMDLVAPRGPGSLANVTSLDLPCRVEYLPDSAFSLKDDPQVDRRIREKYAHVPRGKGIVGISVNSIVEKKCRQLGIDHHRAWVELIGHLRSQGYTVLLIPHSMRLGSKGRHNNDLLSIAEIQTMLPSMDGIYVIDEPYDCKELRVVVGLADYYVASRFHSMISALCNRLPVLVYGWGFQKYTEVMDEFALGQYVHDAAKLSGAALIAGFEEIVRDRPTIQSRIDANLARVREHSARNHQWALQLATPPDRE